MFGLGDRFLGHAERCAALLHLVDGTSENIAEDYQTIFRELEAYGGGLTEKPVVLVLNKIDALDDELRAEALETLTQASGLPVMLMSGASHEGIEQVSRKLMGYVRAVREQRAEAEREK